MEKRLHVKTIEIITNARSARRNPGDISYPADYSIQVADFDIWNHMFLLSYCQDITLHHFSRDPATVLDLGCGTGYWVMEAAKKWPNTKIYGFDIAHIQPRLHRFSTHKPLAHRIEWVHGNLWVSITTFRQGQFITCLIISLDGLPFPTDFFDFVRVAGLGLAVPEDEWQHLLEEIRRVMKPGAPLEIIEEDSLFPCASALIQKAPEVNSPISPASCYSYPELHKSKSAIFYERPNMLSDQRFVSTTLINESYSPMRSPIEASQFFYPPFFSSNQSVAILPPTPTGSSPTSTLLLGETEHPQDHTRLKKSWEAMLETRFLCRNLLSVLPFYLTASSFSTSTTHPQLSVSLPPNSGKLPKTSNKMKASRSMSVLQSRERSKSLTDAEYDFSSENARTTRDNSFSFRDSMTSFPCQQKPVLGTMHLAKTVSTIRSCKEVIWEEYQKLYSRNALQILSRTAPEDDVISWDPADIARRAFDVDWKNWDFDMIDRMCMKNNLSQLCWIQMIPETEHDRPDSRNWRENLDAKSVLDASNKHQVTGFNPDDLCRSLRIFIAIKP